MDLHRNWSLKGYFPPVGACESPLLHHCRTGKSRAPLKALQLISLASISKAKCHFNPSVRCLETTGCPRNRLWTHVCCACGVSCERCSVWVRGKVFVSPSPGPSVCCGSVECVWCCGSSTERKPDPGPERRGPHLQKHDNVRDREDSMLPTHKH